MKIRMVYLKKTLIAAIIFLSIASSANGSEAELSKDEQSLFPIFYDQIASIADNIMRAQVKPGGICNNTAQKQIDDPNDPKAGFMTTYSFGGMALLKAYQMTGEKKYLAAARRFIDFWFANQNVCPDRFGLPGTFYDKIFKNGKLTNYIYPQESPSNRGGPGYDASDADGPMIALTAYRYLLLTGDTGYLKKNVDKLKLIGLSVLGTMDFSDKMTYSHPNWPIKYLMDNCEVYACVSGFGKLLTALGEERLGESYVALAAQTANSVKNWWKPKHNYYIWYKTDKGNVNEKLNWKVYYPDAMEQIWPVLWDVEKPDSPRVHSVWRSFNEHNPDWVRTDVKWPVVSTVAIKLGKFDQAIEHTENIIRNRIMDNTWQVNEQYWTILNCCIDFDISPPLRVVTDSVESNGSEFKCLITSDTNGTGRVRLRLKQLIKANVFIDSKPAETEFSKSHTYIRLILKKGEKKELKIAQGI